MRSWLDRVDDLVSEAVEVTAALQKDLVAMRKKLVAIAKQRKWSDNEDYNPMDYAGGNYDDAYVGGVDSGRIGLAWDLLKEFFNEEVTHDPDA